MENVYTLTVNIEKRGAEMSDGSSSFAGHMWYQIDNGTADGKAAYGFAPDENHHGQPFAPGQTYNNDAVAYVGDSAYSKTIVITAEQYSALKNFGEDPASGGFGSYYNALNNSCIDFVWKGLDVAGLNPTHTQGNLLRMSNIPLLEELFNGGGGGGTNTDGTSGTPTDGTSGIPTVNPSTNTDWNGAVNWTPPRVDPLVLDLDGDGIETLAVNATTHVVFDHDGDGLKIGTGWIAGDDGFLVLDRNGNGTIDNGGELFGDQTLVNGIKAANGFAALSAEDTDKNGKFNAVDANFTAVRIWQDTNSDGVSQTGELHTLTELGIVSINLTSTTTAKVTNGNIQTMNNQNFKNTRRVG